MASAMASVFNGRLKITICEARNLQETKFMTRHGIEALRSGGASGLAAVGSSSESPTSNMPGTPVSSGHNANSGVAHLNSAPTRKESVMPGFQLDPYVQMDVDELSIERTTTRSKTNNPVWNETFTTELLRNAAEVGFTVWHDATMPPDAFLANYKVNLAELIDEKEERFHDLWVRRTRQHLIPFVYDASESRARNRTSSFAAILRPRGLGHASPL